MQKSRKFRSDGGSEVNGAIVDLAKEIDEHFDNSTWCTHRSRIASNALLGSIHTLKHLRDLQLCIDSSGMAPSLYISMAIVYLTSSSDYQTSRLSPLTLKNLASRKVFDGLKEQRYKSIYGFQTGVSLEEVHNDPDAIIKKVKQQLTDVQILIEGYEGENMPWVWCLVARRNTIDPAILYAIPEIRDGINYGWIKLEDYTAAEARIRFNLVDWHDDMKDDMQWNWLKSLVGGEK